MITIKEILQDYDPTIDYETSMYMHQINKCCFSIRHLQQQIDVLEKELVESKVSSMKSYTKILNKISAIEILQKKQTEQLQEIVEVEYLLIEKEKEESIEAITKTPDVIKTIKEIITEELIDQPEQEIDSDFLIDHKEQEPEIEPEINSEPEIEPEVKQIETDEEHDEQVFEIAKDIIKHLNKGNKQEIFNNLKELNKSFKNLSAYQDKLRQILLDKIAENEHNQQ